MLRHLLVRISADHPDCQRVLEVVPMKHDRTRAEWSSDRKKLKMRIEYFIFLADWCLCLEYFLIEIRRRGQLLPLQYTRQSC